MLGDMQRTIGRTNAVLEELIVKAGEAREAGASRRTFFARTAALASSTALGVAGAGLLQPIAADAASAKAVTDTTINILDIAATAEALGITFYYYALASSSLPTVNNDANRNYFQAAVVQEFEHLTILDSLGGAPLATEFYFPTGMFTSELVFFPAAGLLETVFISAYIAAAREFSGAVSKGITKANPTALGLSVQIAGIECEHRALLRVAGNQNPPNNVIIEEALFTSVSAAAGELTPFLSGGGPFVGPIKMPSQADVQAISAPYDFASFPSYTIV